MAFAGLLDHFSHLLDPRTHGRQGKKRPDRAPSLPIGPTRFSYTRRSPQNNDGTFPVSIKRRNTPSSPTRWVCPTYSSSERGAHPLRQWNICSHRKIRYLYKGNRFTRDLFQLTSIFETHRYTFGHTRHFRPAASGLFRRDRRDLARRRLRIDRKPPTRLQLSGPLHGVYGNIDGQKVRSRIRAMDTFRLRTGPGHDDPHRRVSGPLCSRRRNSTENPSSQNFRLRALPYFENHVRQVARSVAHQSGSCRDQWFSSG